MSRAAWLSIGVLALACRGREASRLREGNLAAANGALVAAEQHFAEAASTATDPRPLVLHANALWALEQRSAAVTEWERAQRLDPADRAARLGLALAALDAGDAGAAVELVGPQEGQLLRARALLLRGGEGDAQRALDELTQGPASPEQQFLLGSALTALRRFTDAQAAFDRLSAGDPAGVFLGRYGLARLAAAQGRPTDALLHLAAARAAAPPHGWNGEAVGRDPAFAFLVDSGEFRALVAQNDVPPALPPK